LKTSLKQILFFVTSEEAACLRTYALS